MGLQWDPVGFPWVPMNIHGTPLVFHGRALVTGGCSCVSRGSPWTPWTSIVFPLDWMGICGRSTVNTGALGHVMGLP